MTKAQGSLALFFLFVIIFNLDLIFWRLVFIDEHIQDLKPQVTVTQEAR